MQGACWVYPGPGAHISFLEVSTSVVVSSKTALSACIKHEPVYQFITFSPGLRGGESAFARVTQFPLDLFSFVTYAEDDWENMLLSVLSSVRLCWDHALHGFSLKACCPF